MVNRNNGIGDAQPNLVFNQPKGGRVQSVIKLDVAVAVNADLVPTGYIWSHSGQCAHQGALQCKHFHWDLAGGAVIAQTGLLAHPLPSLLVEVLQMTEGAKREKVPL